MKHIVIGTAGHIDHGKSTLIRTLTGIDPDRLEEEKRRGMTLDLGYAHMRLDSGAVVGFVDVPGHPRYIRNLLAGVGGIHSVLLVVAADDGVMPQTREHVDILSLLGAKSGLVALTKIDMVDDDLAELARSELSDFLRGTFLEDAPLFSISAMTGQGLPELREQISLIADTAIGADPNDSLRIFVDRCFTMRGFGTIAAGTVLSGQVQKGDEVELYPTSTTARVRGIQVYGSPVDTASPGQRAALNLIGIETGLIDRGVQISNPGRYSPCAEFEASMQVLDSSPHPLKSKGRYLVYHGSAEYEAAVSVLGGRAIGPGETGLVRVRLNSAALLIPGDRYILRSPVPGFTVGGGTIRNLQAAGKRTKSQDLMKWPGEDRPLTDYVLYLTREKGQFGLSDSILLGSTIQSAAKVAEAIDRLCAQGLMRRIPGDTRAVVTPEEFENRCDTVLRAVDKFHQAEPLAAGMDKEHLRSLIFSTADRNFYEAVLSDLAERGLVAADGHRVRRPDWTIQLTPRQYEAKTFLEDETKRAGWSLVRRDHLLEHASIPKDTASQLLSMLIDEGQLVTISVDLICHQSVLDRLRGVLHDFRIASPKLDLQRFKEVTGTSRSQAIPLLEYADKLGLTRREGADRWIK